MTRLAFDFHGVRLRLEGDPAVLEALGRDFAWFASGEAPAPEVEIRILLGPVPPGFLPPARARMHLPDAVVYDAGGVRHVDYHGEAVVRIELGRDRATAVGADPDRLREIAYLLALSRVGEHLDRRGIHRLHALAGRIGGRTFAVLLPMGGGKTTLAVALLGLPDASLLSEDTPLATRGGRMLPFPLRLGVRGEGPLPFPPGAVRTFPRLRHGPKRLVDVSAFAGRVGEAAPLDCLLIGQRTTLDAPAVEPIPRAAALPAVAANLLFGLGLPQVVEYFLRGDLADAFGKGGILASRALAALALLGRARTARLALCRDAGLNAAALAAYVRRG